MHTCKAYEFASFQCVPRIASVDPFVITRHLVLYAQYVYSNTAQ